MIQPTRAEAVDQTDKSIVVPQITMLRARQSSPSCLSSTTPTAAVLLQRFGPQCRPRSRCQRLQAMLDERELQIKLAIASSTDRVVSRRQSREGGRGGGHMGWCHRTQAVAVSLICSFELLL